MDSSKTIENHVTSQQSYERVANDWYVEPVSATQRLLQVERPFIGRVLDLCCGMGNIARAFNHYADKAIHSADLVKRSLGFDYGFQYNVGSFEETIPKMHADSIVTNPPYKHEMDIAKLAIEHTQDRVCLFLKLTFLEGQKRSKWLMESPLARVWVFPDRVSCLPGYLHNIQQKKFSSKTAYAWYVWGKNYRGPRQIDWLSLPESSEQRSEKHV